MELIVMVDPVREVKYPVVVEKVGTWSDEYTRNDDCISTPFAMIDEPVNVENDPDVNEKDDIINVELTVKIFAVISELEMVEA
jgi:hypothetical protein